MITYQQENKGALEGQICRLTDGIALEDNREDKECWVGLCVVRVVDQHGSHFSGDCID